MKEYRKASDINVGVVGYGGSFNMGRSHLEECTAAGMTPCAVAEIDPKRLEVATADFPGIETHAGVSQMLKKSAVDLVIIITPHNTHAPLALECLRAGRHVVCEKPFAVSTAECDAMIAAAKKSRVMLSTYHNRHWDGCIMRAVKEIKAGVIGDVFRIEAHMGGRGKPADWWRTSRTISGGILFDWGVHLLEYSLQIIDSGVVEVMGVAKSGYWAPQTAWKRDTIEDEGFLVARCDNGKWLSLCISSLDAKGKEGWLEITGTTGTYVMDGATWKTVARDADGTTVTKTGWNPKPEGWRFYRNVANHLTAGEQLVITPEWARRPIHIIDMACLSVKKGCALKTRYR